MRQALTEAEFEPIATADPDQVPVLLKRAKPHLVLLDLMLPGSDGLELMKDLLGKADLPVIFVSGYGGGELISQAFESGASDYILKPFSPSELVARVRAALRKGEDPSAEPAEPYVSGDLTIDYAQRRVLLAGRALNLTALRIRPALRAVRPGRTGGPPQPVAEKGMGPGPLRGYAGGPQPWSEDSGKSSTTTAPTPPTCLSSDASATSCPRDRNQDNRPCWGISSSNPPPPFRPFPILFPSRA